jgi:two-component system sensor histidine kinase GlrK
MRLTIFSRLVIGYLAIFVLAMAVSIYAIAQLRQLENITHSILKVDNRLIDYEQKLSDILLSMMRYEKKFVILKDKGLYKQFLLAQGDFDRHLKEIMTIAGTDQALNLLIRVEQHYERYKSLFEEEVKYLLSGKTYDSDSYKREKEYAVNIIMEDLQKIGAYSQQSTYHKVKKLSKAETNASRVAIVIGLTSLIFGIIISIFITINITRPLSVMKKRTREIAGGHFKEDLKLSSPPEIKELAQAFNIMCARLKEIDKMKSDFYSLMSHELRTPLTTIKEGTNLFLDEFKEGGTSEKQKRILAIINEECIRLINLVNSLLDHSKLEAGMMVYNFTNTDLATLINRVTREMEPLAETKKIKIGIENSNGLPFVKVDIDRILQVLRNLIGNALKFTPNDGNVRIIVQPVEQGIEVSVADTGEGIPEENLATIFDKYHQAVLSSSNKIKGTGLGLSIVKHIINAHGGKVWVESTSGQGSTFAFVLPV